VVTGEVASAALLVETDKPVYTPGQTVKIRVLSLTPALMPRAANVTVTVKDPRAFVMGRWVDVQVEPSTLNP
jgi:Tat protein secretion system quality control protein TatD with DNase activity